MYTSLLKVLFGIAGLITAAVITLGVIPVDIGVIFVKAEFITEFT